MRPFVGTIQRSTLGGKVLAVTTVDQGPPVALLEADDPGLLAGDEFLPLLVESAVLPMRGVNEVESGRGDD